MQKRNEWVANRRSGGAVAGATVTVYNGGTATPATIYSDDGVTVIGTSSVVTDVNGNYTYWAADGVYDEAITGGGITPYYNYGVQLSDINPYLTDVTSTKYGAVGSGLVDDSAAIASAIADASANSGTVYFPEGYTFLIETEIALASNVTLTGKGVLLSGITGNNFMFEGNSAHNVTLDGLVVNGASVAAAYNGTAFPGLFGFYGCDNLKVINCHIYDSPADGVYVGGAVGDPSAHVAIRGNYITDSRRDGIAITNAVDITVSDNDVNDTYGVGIDLEPNANMEVARPIISKNRCYNSTDIVFETYYNGRGLDIQGEASGASVSSVVVEGNLFELNIASPDDTETALRAVQVLVNTVDDIVFTGNTVKSNLLSNSTASYGLVSVWNTTGWVSSGNHIVRPVSTPNVCNGLSYGYFAGMYFKEDAGTAPAPSIKGDRIVGGMRYGLILQGVDDSDIDITTKMTANGSDSAPIYLNDCNRSLIKGILYGGEYTLRLSNTITDVVVAGGVWTTLGTAHVYIPNDGSTTTGMVVNSLIGNFCTGDTVVFDDAGGGLSGANYHEGEVYDT